MPGGRILVVDDDVTVRDALARALEREGYVVAQSPNGADALAILPRFEPDLIVLDMMMPGMNGRQFLTVLRQELGIRHVPVVVLTAIYGLTMQQAAALGVADMVEKPFDLDNVLNKIALALFRTEVQRPAARQSTPEHEPVVVVVDGDRAVLRYLEEVLSPHGYVVVSMARATEELPRLTRVLEPHAIVLGLDTGAGDALAALRQLRADAALDTVPILVPARDAAALARAQQELAALAAEGALKPLSTDTLLAFLSAPPATSRRTRR